MPSVIFSQINLVISGRVKLPARYTNQIPHLDLKLNLTSKLYSAVSFSFYHQRAERSENNQDGKKGTLVHQMSMISRVMLTITQVQSKGLN